MICHFQEIAVSRDCRKVVHTDNLDCFLIPVGFAWIEDKITEIPAWVGRKSTDVNKIIFVKGSLQSNENKKEVYLFF